MPVAHARGTPLFDDGVAALGHCRPLPPLAGEGKRVGISKAAERAFHRLFCPTHLFGAYGFALHGVSRLALAFWPAVRGTPAFCRPSGPRACLQHFVDYLDRAFKGKVAGCRHHVREQVETAPFHFPVLCRKLFVGNLGATFAVDAHKAHDLFQIA